MVAADEIVVEGRQLKELHDVLAGHVIAVDGAVFIASLTGEGGLCVILQHAHMLREQLPASTTVVSSVWEGHIEEVAAAQVGGSAKVVEALIVPAPCAERVGNDKEWQIPF